jgi:hypothetical protein
MRRTGLLAKGQFSPSAVAVLSVKGRQRQAIGFLAHSSINEERFWIGFALVFVSLL